jgi:hypothetical protein
MRLVSIALTLYKVQYCRTAPNIEYVVDEALMTYAHYFDDTMNITECAWSDSYR